MNAKTAPKFELNQPVAWTLRDEMAMRLTSALVVRGGWVGGDGNVLSSTHQYARAGYEFADAMLKAREG